MFLRIIYKTLNKLQYFEFLISPVVIANNVDSIIKLKFSLTLEKNSGNFFQKRSIGLNKAWSPPNQNHNYSYYTV